MKVDGCNGLRYYAVQWREWSGRLRYVQPLGMDIRQVAILDFEDLVCEWIDIDVLRGLNLSVGGYDWMIPFSSLRKFGGDDIHYQRRSQTSVCLRLGKVSHAFEVGHDSSGGKALFYNKVEFIPVRYCLSLETVLFAYSDDGVYRIDFVIGHSVTRKVESDNVSIWIDMETKGVLGYKYNGDKYVGVGTSDLAGRKWKDLLARSAKVAMFGGNRVY